MRLFLCWICPPLAILLCGKPFSAMLSCFLCVFGWIPAVRYAREIVDNHFADNRTKRTIKAINSPRWVSRMAQQEPTALRKQKVAKKPAKPVQEIIDNPHVGMHGTVFRRKLP